MTLTIKHKIPPIEFLALHALKHNATAIKDIKA
jgi:hypothetical protein